MLESIHEVRHLPIKLSAQPIGTRQRNNLNQETNNINQNKTDQMNPELVEARENYNAQENDLTNDETTRQTEHNMERNDTNVVINGNNNCNESDNTRNELSGCTERFVETETTNPNPQQNLAVNEKHEQYNDEHQDGNDKHNSNDDKQYKHPDFDENTDVYYQSTGSSGEHGYGINGLDIEATRKATEGTRKSAEGTWKGTESMKALDETTSDDSFSWLGNLDQIAQRLNDIFSTYGITIPIPDWSEDLPSIIPLEDGDVKKGEKKDLRMSRRKYNFVVFS
uniref:Uncharacterized protein n=1 Tax=Cacopsylla melanoneura TaxID=428564 RepID=A0A8D8Z8N8_9HEMI